MNGPAGSNPLCQSINIYKKSEIKKILLGIYKHVCSALQRKNMVQRHFVEKHHYPHAFHFVCGCLLLQRGPTLHNFTVQVSLRIS